MRFSVPRSRKKLDYKFLTEGLPRDPFPAPIEPWRTTDRIGPTRIGEPTDEQLAAMTGGYDTERLNVLDGMKPADRPEHVKLRADEVLAEPKREPMIFRKYRENAEAIRNMGREEIAKAHALGVPASYASRELGEGIVRETPDGIRHLERKVDGAWVEVATFPPREDWVDPKA